MQRGGDPFEDKLIGTANIREAGMRLEREHEGIRETSRSLKDRATAARPTKDGDSVLFAGREMHVVGRSAGRTQHYEVTVALPKAKHRIATLLIQFVE